MPAPGASQPPASPASAGPASPDRYGGSRNDQIERLIRRPEPGGVPVHEPDVARSAEPGEVGGRERQRPAIVLHEPDLGRAARGGLQADRTGAAEQIEKARPAQRRLAGIEDREQRLARPVAGRPDRPVGRRQQRPPAPAAGDDPHRRMIAARRPGVSG